MQLSHNTAPALVAILPDQFWPERTLVRALSQAQQADQYVTLRILIRQERFPPAIRRVVSSEEFHRLGSDFVVYLVDLRRAIWSDVGVVG